jgi:hypothetical protein
MKEYGIEKTEDIMLACTKVCNILGNGSNNNADEFMFNIALAETAGGTTPDSLASNGFGVFQFDRIGVKDIIGRTNKTNKRKVEQTLAIKIDEVNPEDLADNVLLGAIFCRLKWKLVPKQIPLDIYEQARDWKTYYNTMAGKGTEEHFIEAVRHYRHKKKKDEELRLNTQKRWHDRHQVESQSRENPGPIKRLLRCFSGRLS